MRTRSRSTVHSFPYGYGFVNTTEYVNFPENNSSSFGHIGGGTFHDSPQTSEIQDELTDRSLNSKILAEARRSRKALDNYRFNYLDPRALGYRRLVRPNHKCVHIKEVIEYYKDIQSTHVNHVSPNNPNFDRYESTKRVYDSGASWLANECGTTLNNSFYASWRNGAFDQYIADDCPNHDWFHLLDAFDEALDGFIPQSFFVGEDIVEHAVFTTALKAVINPTRALSTFLKAGIKYVKKYRKKSLGRVARELTKDGASGWLSYNFAIKPAIEDIKSTIDAHRKVNDRMGFLIRNRGRYVPVRVSQKFLREPEITAENNAPGLSSFFAGVEKRSVATIGAWAKVRDDLTYKETWKAYFEYFGIHKVVGLAWELIPFSFMVDWVTNAQERINSLTRLRLGGPFCDIQGICSSLKTETKSILYGWPGSNNSIGPIVKPDSYFKIGSLNSISYNRAPGLPDTSGVVDFSTLGLFHGTALASIIIQRKVR
jgi:hypothetical protein